ncbi:uncharacterized protein ACA1_125420 [Acanthamoeba castellanii str. Neff]|uniref:Uncharacterized protein n=1 Tax=Acanthamoeba castellanii (strain ATCC 30010 / Neff) TaxID=1257118 RepID=L8GPW0_ACACF|nr:uncharacterized protein ACA1_125420 [Acanthamoeba castellanii str. Neff]ELR14678.1 hypothetical protein ACA1_125420 [Acanthamoeba castellanii str. Neff]
MATTTRCCDTEYPHYHAAAPSLTTSAAAQAGASFWVGSLALRASSFRREHPPTGTGQAVPICILAAHHLNNGEAPKHQEQVNAEEWPLQLTVAGVCTLRQAHVAVLKTAVPLLFHVLSAAAPPQSTTTLPAGPEPPTYLATLISQLRSNTQALAEPLSLSLVAHACLWLWLGSGGSGAARQAYPDDYAHRESADGLPGVARGCRLDFAAEPRRFEPALPLPAAASSRGDGGGGERGPPRDRQHGPQHHEKEEIEGGAPSEGGTSTGRGVHQEACTVAT